MGWHVQPAARAGSRARDGSGDVPPATPLQSAGRVGSGSGRDGPSRPFIAGVGSLSARVLDGKAIANQIKRELAEQVVEFIGNNAVVPTLAAILVGDDPASQVYVRNKRRACEQIGIESQLIDLPVRPARTTCWS